MISKDDTIKALLITPIMNVVAIILYTGCLVFLELTGMDPGWSIIVMLVYDLPVVMANLIASTFGIMYMFSTTTKKVFKKPTYENKYWILLGILLIVFPIIMGVSQAIFTPIIADFICFK